MADGVHALDTSGARRLNNQLAERALLGALITKPQLLASLPAGFDARHYYDPLHSDIHRLLVEIGQPGVPAAIALMQALAVNDRETAGYISGLMTAAVSYSPGAAEQYAGAVTDMFRRRGLVGISERMREDAFADGADATADLAIAHASTALEELTAQHGSTRQFISLDDAIDAELDRADRVARGESTIGLTTGFPSVDELIGGLDPATLTIIAGRPGMGKSSWGWQAAIAAARTGVGVCVISLEMSAQELAQRALCSVSRLPLAVLRKGRHGPYAEKLLLARRELRGLPLSIEDGGGLTAGMIALKLRAAKRRHGLGLFMVDHLHIVRPDEGDVRQGATWAVGRISGAMKRMAKEHQCPALVLAQLNRGVEGRDDKRPGLADLRQAGEIEQDADTIGFVYRPEYYLGSEPEQSKGEPYEKFANRLTEHEQARIRLKGKAELIFAKARSAAPGTVNLTFHAETTSFSEVDDDH